MHGGPLHHFTMVRSAGALIPGARYWKVRICSHFLSVPLAEFLSNPCSDEQVARE
jgi:hypothetical protein